MSSDDSEIEFRAFELGVTEEEIQIAHDSGYTLKEWYEMKNRKNRPNDKQ